MIDLNPTTMTALLASYDSEVERILVELLASRSSGTERVQLLDKLRGSIAVHDSMVESVLCPSLDALPGGSRVADRLRVGCEERDALLIRFGHLTNGVAARNVYPIDGSEIEQIIEGLERSFRHHEHHEATAVAAIMEASPAGVNLEVVTASMTLAEQHAPTRGHKATVEHATSTTRRGVWHCLDKIHDWNDTHHGWIR